MASACRNSKKECRVCNGDPCIQSIPLLSNLDDDEVSQVSTGVFTNNYKKGDLIFQTGDKADRLYIVCSGRMKIFKYTPDGKEQILYIYGPGDFVGGFNLMKEDEYKYNAVALEDTVISTLTKREFDRIAMDNPKILIKVLEKAYERIRWAEELIGVLSSGTADSKVARLLINLIQDFGVETDEGILLKLSMNREEMGNYAGISRETMTRKLGELRDLGLIDFKGNRLILIKDKNKLEQML